MVLIGYSGNFGTEMNRVIKTGNTSWSGSTSLSERSPTSEYVSTKNAAEEYLKTLGSKMSVAAVSSKLNLFARFFYYKDLSSCDWHMMRYEHVLDFIEYLKQKKKDCTRQKGDGLQAQSINTYLCALKGVTQTAWNLGQISDQDLMRIKAIKAFRVYRQPAGRSLTRRESRELLNACQGISHHELRDYAVIALLLGCGLRRAEVANIELQNVSLEEKKIRLVGKENKERFVYMTGDVFDAVYTWMQVRQSVIEEWNLKNRYKSGNAGDGSTGFLFGRWTRGGHYLVVNRPMNPRAIWSIVNKYKLAAMARVEHAGSLKDITTHDLRRTFATRLLDRGVDLLVVRNMMGHANIATTALYDRRGEEAMRKATEFVEL